MKFGQARNPFKTVFVRDTFVGMPMASISVHENSINHECEDGDCMCYKDIPVEICVGGQCIGTTLDKIIEQIIHEGA